MSQLNGKPPAELTLRDYFAAHALGGLMSTTLTESLLSAMSYDKNDQDELIAAAVSVQWHVARMAYESADAMLAYRDGQGPPLLPGQ